MVEVAHMVVAASLTILAPGHFVEVVPLGGGGGGGGGGGWGVGGGGAVSWAMSWACRGLPTLGLGVPWSSDWHTLHHDSVSLACPVNGMAIMIFIVLLRTTLD